MLLTAGLAHVLVLWILLDLVRSGGGMSQRRDRNSSVASHHCFVHDSKPWTYDLITLSKASQADERVFFPFVLTCSFPPHNPIFQDI